MKEITTIPFDKLNKISFKIIQSETANEKFQKGRLMKRR